MKSIPSNGVDTPVKKTEIGDKKSLMPCQIKHVMKKTGDKFTPFFPLSFEVK